VTRKKSKDNSAALFIVFMLVMLDIALNIWELDQIRKRTAAINRTIAEEEAP
jgi:hypothetical protein